VSLRARRAVFLPAAAGLAALLVWGLSGLPSFGHYRGPYGLVLNRVAVSERHATNVVTAVVFDYRGFDTMGEEFILFASVIGVALLLRTVREEKQGRPHEGFGGEGVRLGASLLVAPLVVLGLYVLAHGPLTPGGGFQGGVILAAALALLYLAGEYGAYRAASPRPLVDFGDGAGAGSYVAIGLAALLLGDPFLHNLLPLGTTGSLASAGSIPMLSVATGLEVAAAFTLLVTEFVEELVLTRVGAAE
jgi:multicomponent Na+:H+ antiporter subunit B